MKSETEGWDSQHAAAWLELCEQACVNDQVFEIFRSGYPTTIVCEFSNPALGHHYLDFIKDNSTQKFFENLGKFKLNDSIGQPKVFAFPEVGQFAPTTLSYVKHLVAIQEEFGSLDEFDIVEIGPAFGGQCLTIAQEYDFKSYHLIDFKPVVNLAKKYLAEHGITNVSTTSAGEVENISKPKKYDLLISNSSFAENSKEGQEMYIEKIVKHCNRGYIVYNTAHFTEEQLLAPVMPYGVDQMVEILKQYFDVRISYDIPTPVNQPILTWG